MKTKFFQKLLATGLTAALLVGTVVPAYTAEADTANVQEPSMELAYEDGIAEEVYLQNNDDAEGVFWYGLATQEEIKEEIAKQVSIACGKEMHIKYIDTKPQGADGMSEEQELSNFANQFNIPFDVIE